MKYIFFLVALHIVNSLNFSLSLCIGKDNLVDWCSLESYTDLIVVGVKADMLGNNPGAMFEAVTKLSCEIIEFGWSKDRALVDTFLMGLASCIRERNNYDEEV
jgi:PI4-kinase N-terminal region